MRVSNAASQVESGGEAARPPDAPCAGLRREIAGWSRLIEIRPAWTRLAGEAVEPNIFYDPDYLIAAVTALGLAERVSALLVWEPGAPMGVDRLLGFFPFLRPRHRLRPVPVVEALVQPYGPSSMPLIARGRVDAVMAETASWLRDEYAITALIFRQLPSNGPVTDALLRICAEAKLQCLELNVQQRPVLDGASADSAKGKQRRELRRLSRRLAEYGTVDLVRADTPDRLAPALDTFLRLEAEGWKGRRGTAAALQNDITRMFRMLVDGLGRTGRCRIDMLCVGGLAGAVTISLGQPPHWWLWKIAYDERLSSMAPGIQLVADITGQATRAQAPELWDSCAVPGTMMDRIWPQRRPYLDLAIHSGRPMQTHALRALETLRRQGRSTAKRVLRLLRG